jgi:hypothetical protein
MHSEEECWTCDDSKESSFLRLGEVVVKDEVIAQSWIGIAELD